MREIRESRSYPNGGGSPAGPVADRSLNLYGTAVYDGEEGFDLAFRLTPPAPGQTAWTENVLHSFTGVDGFYPAEGLIESNRGVLYGTTSAQRANTYGTLFSLTPRDYGGHSTPWNRVTLYGFQDVAKGSRPTGPLVQEILPDGRLALFGMTEGGGRYDYGAVYEFIP